MTDPAGGDPDRDLDRVLEREDLFLRWVKSTHPVDRPLTVEQAAKVWNKLIDLQRRPSYRVHVRLDRGHRIGVWTGPHISGSIQGSKIHIPVDPAFRPPTGGVP